MGQHQRLPRAMGLVPVHVIAARRDSVAALQGILTALLLRWHSPKRGLRSASSGYVTLSLVPTWTRAGAMWATRISSTG